MFGNSIDADNYQRITTPMVPVSPYGCSKLFSHNLVHNYRNAYKMFIVSGILFNHESPRRGETFVTRKITIGLAKICKGLSKILELGNLDSSINRLPDFDKLLNDNISYLSDTIGYIGYNYIKDCCDRYEKQHPLSNKEQLFQEMADIIGIDVDIIKENQENSGGGQYLIKNTDPLLWGKIYDDCTPLYHQMLDYQKRFPINPGQIQFWTAEMWSLLWNLWMYSFETRISDELSFSWATDNIKKYNEHPILHMAGVTDNLKSTKFYKILN
jgi:hypothetical protein